MLGGLRVNNIKSTYVICDKKEKICSDLRLAALNNIHVVVFVSIHFLLVFVLYIMLSFIAMS